MSNALFVLSSVQATELEGAARRTIYGQDRGARRAVLVSRRTDSVQMFLLFLAGCATVLSGQKFHGRLVPEFNAATGKVDFRRFREFPGFLKGPQQPPQWRRCCSKLAGRSAGCCPVATRIIHFDSDHKGIIYMGLTVNDAGLRVEAATD